MTITPSLTVVGTNTSPLGRHLRALELLVLCALICQLGCAGFASRNRGVNNIGVVTQGLIGGPMADNGEGYCRADGCHPGEPNPLRPPAELAKVSLPAYRIEPPDVLLINAVRMVPLEPYFIQTTDVLQIVVAGALPEQPIAGNYQVESSGIVNLGPSYGPVKIAGLSMGEAHDTIVRHLSQVLQVAEVSISLLQVSGQQQIAGEHLVGPDGTINLGIYGSVYIAGRTVAEAREIVERHLRQYMSDAKIALDVLAYNSKVYYIVTEGAGFGDRVVRLPITGNETVLDAISQIGGLQQTSSTKMWISRPSPHGANCDQVLPVNWASVTAGGATSTNYQLLPGDRLFIAEDRVMAIENAISRVLNPVERVFGFSLLGSQTIQSLQRFPEGRFF